jgi:hypothetical protein
MSAYPSICRAIPVCCIVVFAEFACAQTTYTFTRIANSATDDLSPLTVGAPSISEQGHVAFSARNSEETIATAFRSGPTGGLPLLPIATTNTPGVGSIAANISVNASGQVAFWGRSTLAGVQEAIFRGNGGTIDTIVDTGTAFNFLTVVPSINDSGLVAFQAELDGPSFAEGLFTGSGGAINTIFRTDTSQFSDSFAAPSINNAGQIAFLGALDAGPEGIFRYSGGSYSTIVDDTGPYSPFFDDEPSLNAGGSVALIASSDDFSVEYILVGDGSSPALPIADTVGAYDNFVAVSLNDAGKVAFRATLDDFSAGIFTGSDPLAHRVIRTGDSLDGSTVEGLAFFREGLAANDNIAFTAYLADGRAVVMLAMPVVCYANCDGSTSSPVLTANDFVCFVNRFAAGEAYANCDGSTSSPALTANDFVCFVNAYAAGCS